MKNIAVMKDTKMSDIFDPDDKVINIMTPSSFSARKYGLPEKGAFLYKGFPMYLDRTVIHARKEDKAHVDALLKEDVELVEVSLRKLAGYGLKASIKAGNLHKSANGSREHLNREKGWRTAVKKMTRSKDVKIHAMKESEILTEEKLHEGGKLIKKPHPFNQDHEAYDVHHNGEHIGQIYSHTTTTVAQKNSIRRLNTGKEKKAWYGAHKSESRGYYHYKNKNDAANSVIEFHKRNVLKEDIARRIDENLSLFDRLNNLRKSFGDK